MFSLHKMRQVLLVSFLRGHRTLQSSAAKMARNMWSSFAEEILQSFGGDGNPSWTDP